MVDDYTGHRLEEYTIMLLDRNDQVERVLKTTQGGKLSLNDEDTVIQGGGTITIQGEEEINWNIKRVRPIIKLDNGSTWELGTFKVTAPIQDFFGPNVTTELELLDKLVILEDDSISDFLSLPKNANITDAIESLIVSTGELTYNITKSTKTLNEMLVWEPNTSKLSIINELTKYINYFPIWTDTKGIYQVSPFQLAKDRPVVRTFQRGEKAIHLSRYTIDKNNSRVPNRVKLVVSEGSDGDYFKAEATNTNNDSPYSYDNVGGRWIDYTENVEAESPAILKELADRKLEELTNPTASLDIEHLMVPLNLRDRVRFVTEKVDVNATVVRMDISLIPGSLCQTTLQVVQKL